MGNLEAKLSIIRSITLLAGLPLRHIPFNNFLGFYKARSMPLFIAFGYWMLHLARKNYYFLDDFLIK